MEVKLLNSTPLEVADIAICKCYGNKPHIVESKIKARINRVANVSKHASTIEHLTYTFDINGISRACLQELARHRIASYTVKSSRYTLQELRSELPFETSEDLIRVEKYCVIPNMGSYNDEDLIISEAILLNLETLRKSLSLGVSNDIAKYCMPEAYKTSLVMTINARALQNFLELRSSKHALWEIQNLAKAMYDVLPENHKFLFDYIYGDSNDVK